MSKRDKAKRLLKFYMRKLHTNAGLRWDSDNDSEMDEIADCLVEAAAEEASYEYADYLNSQRQADSGKTVESG